MGYSIVQWQKWGSGLESKKNKRQGKDCIKNKTSMHDMLLI